MNFEENDGIPPYDLPFDNNSNEENPVNNEITNKEYDTNQEKNVEPEEVSMGESMDETFVQPEQLNVGEFVDGVVSDDYIPEPNEQHAHYQENKHFNVPTTALLILAGIILVAGSLFAIYGTELVPYLPAKLNNSDQNVTNDVSDNDLAELPKAEETGVNDGADYQDADIDIVKNRNKNKVVSEMDSFGGDLDLPPLPGAGGSSKRDFMANENGSNKEISTNMVRRFSSGSTGRMDPFNPNGGNNLYDILVPPSSPTPDIDAQMLLTLTISGIMYTPESPSALINIAGNDQLVRTGDKFDNFSVIKITKDKVTVKSGKNIYTASVGEKVDIEAIGVNAVPNLNRKFAGPYSKGGGRIIEINSLD